MNVNEIEADALIGRVSATLRKVPEIKPPEWAMFAKTGAHKERPPQQEDWWWIRAAAVMRKISVNGRMGVSRLRKEYGGRKNRGHKPEKKYSASGAVMRNILQQLESAGFVRKEKSKGRVLTPQGAALLANAAKEIVREGKGK